MDNHIFPFLWLRGEEEKTIRKEMAAIDDCGIKAVCLESRPLPGTDGDGYYCSERWWRDLDIVLDEAQKRQMRIWVLDDAHFPTGYANGLIASKYNERKKKYINYNSADIYSTGVKMSLNISKMLQPKLSFMDLGKPIDFEEVARNSILAVIAAEMGEKNRLSGKTMDVTGQVNGEWLEIALPEGAWRIFVVFNTRQGGGRENYINMLDEESVSTLLEAVYEPHYAHYGHLFGGVFAGFFSDEPEMGNVAGYAGDERIGCREMPLPWSAQMPEEMERRFGPKWTQRLPLLWCGCVDHQLEADTRLGYMDIITRRYQRCFGDQIGGWCAAHGVEHIGHVVEDNGQDTRLGAGDGHYFRAISGQHMAGIDVIRNQILPGGGETDRILMGTSDSYYYHYVLGKLGTSAAGIDPKKQGRTMCELFGAYGWGLGVRDMSWILNHLFSRGINNLVPHAFSMAKYPDCDCPPHFYAGGNNAQFRDFSDLMHYANRMCELLSGGQHVADVGLLYQAEAEWMGDYQPITVTARELTRSQIDFDILPIDVFTDRDRYQTQQAEEKFSVNKHVYRTIFIPEAENITKELADTILNTPEVTFVFTGGYPYQVIGGDDKILECVKKKAACVKVGQVGKYCKQKALQSVQCGDVDNLTVYHYRKNGDWYLIFNESLTETVETTVTLAGSGRVYSYNGWADSFTELDTAKSFSLVLKPYELQVFYITEENILVQPKPIDLNAQIDISEDWEVSTVRAIDYPAFQLLQHMKTLLPVSELMRDFSGIIRYEKKITLPKRTERLVFSAEQVFECVRVYLDGVLVGGKIMPPYDVELGSCDEGEHILTVEVSTNMEREQMQFPAPPFTLYFSAMQSTGMFGRVKLKMCVKEELNEESR